MKDEYNEWTIDLSDSIKAFNSIRETILPKLISGKIYDIESSEDEVLLKFDTISGIDYIRENNIGLQGIAARAQWGNAWNTFTIRSERYNGTETELNKRLNQIKHGYFYPAFTLQAYFDSRMENNLLSIAVIKTIDLYNLYKNHNYLFKKNCSDNDFVYIEWDKISEYIKEYHNNPTFNTT